MSQTPPQPGTQAQVGSNPAIPAIDDSCIISILSHSQSSDLFTSSIALGLDLEDTRFALVRGDVERKITELPRHESAFIRIHTSNAPKSAKKAKALLKYFDKHKQRRLIRLNYHPEFDEIIIRSAYNPHFRHELLARNFVSAIVIDAKSPHGDHLLVAGSSRFDLPNGGFMEGDGVIIPSSRISSVIWPSVVVEVGSSKSLSDLQYDATRWLTEDRGVKLVILLGFVSPSGIIVKFCRPTPNNLPPFHDENETKTFLSEDQVTEIRIPFSDIYDDLEPALAGQDVVVSREAMARLYELIFMRDYDVIT